MSFRKSGGWWTQYTPFCTINVLFNCYSSDSFKIVTALTVLEDNCRTGRDILWYLIIWREFVMSLLMFLIAHLLIRIILHPSSSRMFHSDDCRLWCRTIFALIFMYKLFLCYLTCFDSSKNDPKGTSVSHESLRTPITTNYHNGSWGGWMIGYFSLILVHFVFC